MNFGKTWWLRGSIAVAICGIAAAAIFHPLHLGNSAPPDPVQSQKAVTVSVAAVKKKTIVQKATLSGDVESKDSLDVTADAVGRVKSVAVDVGQKVAAGDVLATLDATTQHAAVEEAAAGVSQAEGRLMQQTNASQDQIDIAQANVDAAQAKLDQLVNGPDAAALLKAQNAADSANKELAAEKQYLAFEQSPDSPLYIALEKAEQTLQSVTAGTAASVVSASSAKSSQQSDVKAAQENLANVQDEQGSYGVAVQNARSEQALAAASLSDYVRAKPQTSGAYDAQYESLTKAMIEAQDNLAVAQLNWSKAIQSAQIALDQKQTAAASGEQLADAQLADAIRNGQSALEEAKSARTEALQKLDQQLLSAQNAADLAKTNVAALTAPPDPNDVVQAKSNLQRAQSELSLLLHPNAGLVASLQADLAGAKAKLEAAQAAEERTIVRAPFAATVSQRSAVVGLLVQQNRPLFTLVGDVKEITAQVDEQHLGSIRSGDEASFSLASKPGQTFKAKVVQVAPTSDTQTLTFSVLLMPEQQDALTSGESAAIEVVTAQLPDALIVPAAAVVNVNGHPQVFVVDGSKTAQLKDVQTGYSDGAETQIVKGLSAGDTVVTMGQTFLASGDKVKIDSLAADSAKSGDAAASESDIAKPADAASAVDAAKTADAAPPTANDTGSGNAPANKKQSGDGTTKPKKNNKAKAGKKEQQPAANDQKDAR